MTVKMNAYNNLMDLHDAVLGCVAQDALVVLDEWSQLNPDIPMDDAEWDRAFIYAMSYVVGHLDDSDDSRVIKAYIQEKGIDFSGGLDFGEWKP